MAKQKACKECKTIYEGDECPICHSKECVNSFKGRFVIEDPENSEIAKKLKLTKKGMYAIKIK